MTVALPMLASFPSQRPSERAPPFASMAARTFAAFSGSMPASFASLESRGFFGLLALGARSSLGSGLLGLRRHRRLYACDLLGSIPASFSDMDSSEPASTRPLFLAAFASGCPDRYSALAALASAAFASLAAFASAILRAFSRLASCWER